MRGVVAVLAAAILGQVGCGIHFLVTKWYRKDDECAWFMGWYLIVWFLCMLYTMCEMLLAHPFDFVFVRCMMVHFMIGTGRKPKTCVYYPTHTPLIVHNCMRIQISHFPCTLHASSNT
jgi:hypothetical protein